MQEVHGMQQKKVILITGCASGVARYVAEPLYREGHFLALTDAKKKGMREAAEKNGWTGDNAMVRTGPVQHIQVRREGLYAFDRA